jgi:hypothetical protein
VVDGDEVEAPGAWFGFHFRAVIQGRLLERLRFDGPNRILRAVLGISAQFDFDENEGFSVQGDHVDLAVPRFESARDHGVANRQKVGGCPVFALRTYSSKIRHGSKWARTGANERR